MGYQEAPKYKSPDEKFCRECGVIIKEKAEICPNCGVRQFQQSSFLNFAPNGKSKLIAALLAFFLGGLGIHKFYLGQFGLGILFLLFSWTFIPSIVAFIEGVIFLTMSDDLFNEKYGHL